MLLQWLLLRAGICFAPANDQGADEGADDADGDEGADEGADDVDGDEGADDADGDEGADEDADDEGEASTKQTRGESRHAKLSRENIKLREDYAAAQARLDERSRAPQQPDNGDAARARAEKLALMEPAERTAFLATEKADNLGQQVALQNMALADIRDEGKYDAKASTNPVYAKHKDWVEKALIDARKAGNNPSREALLRWKIGDDAMNAKPSKKKVAEKNAAGQRVATAKGTGTSARGDSAGGEKRNKNNPAEMTAGELKARLLERERTGAVS